MSLTKIAEFSAWPEVYEHVRLSLAHMATPEGSPRYKESWSYDIFTTLIHVFPPSEFYRHRPHHDLWGRLESMGLHEVVPGQHSDGESYQRRPTFVVDQGIHQPSQKTVLLVEVLLQNKIDPEDSECFTRFCNTIRAMGPTGELANVLLIAGGKVYRWRYEDMPLDGLSNSDLEKMESIDVYDVKFLQLLGRIRNEYVDTLLKSA